MEHLEEITQFFDKWRDHRSQQVRLEDINVNSVRNSLGYLTMQFDFDIPHAEMLQEARNLKDFFVYHRAAGNHKGWRSLCIHGISSVHTENHDRYGFPTRELAPYDWTDITKFCPITTRFFRDTFGYEWYERVRFMLLEPGGYILPHADVDWKQLGPVNLALNNPDGCEFIMEDHGIIPFTNGTANMLAIGNVHAVYNNSNEDRFHIIVHGARGSAWSDYITNSYKASINA